MQLALIVEDLPEAQIWLKNTLKSVYADIEILCAKTLAEARELTSRYEADIALVDIGLPDGSGISLINELNQQHAKTLCIVTSVFDDDQHLFSALRAGAKGYVLKDQPQDDLATMLKGIIAGQPPLSPAIARRLLDFFQPQESLSEDQQQLTNREQEVLTLIAKVGEILGITRNTAAGYVKALYRKLNVSSRAEATLEATRRGMVNPNSL